MLIANCTLHSLLLLHIAEVHRSTQNGIVVALVNTASGDDGILAHHIGRADAAVLQQIFGICYRSGVRLFIDGTVPGGRILTRLIDDLPNGVGIIGACHPV